MYTTVTTANSIIPKAIGLYTGLESLHLMYNRNLSGDIPDEMGNLTNLTNLNLAGNSLNGTIPDSIGNLTKLKTLDLSANAVNSSFDGYREEGLGGDIPASIGKLMELTTLTLGDYSNFTSLPSTIGNLTSFQSLSVNQTKLSSVPVEIKNLTNLTNLNLSYNTISQEIPQEWSSLQNLKSLNLKCNALTYNTANLNLSRNILFDVPNWKNMGTSSTFNYLNTEKIDDATVKNSQYDVTANYDNYSLIEGLITFDVRDSLLCVYQKTKATYFP
ncbi:leucine-rich repeat domain-containing protein [Listeria monocytogenes]